MRYCSRTSSDLKKRKSTSSTALELVTSIVESFNQHKKDITMFLDLAKAFDTVSLTCLIFKLENKGVRDIQLQIFRSYLS